MKHPDTLHLACAVALLWLTSAAAVEIEEGDQPGFEQLKTVLFSGSVRGREAAAERLCTLRTPEAMALLFEGLSDKIAAYLCVDALEKALKTKPEGMTALLLPGLSHKDYRTRMFCAWLLGLCKDTSSSPALARLLKDENFNVRMYAAEALRTSGDKSAAGALIGALKDSYPLVRLHAAAALGTIKDPAAVAPLSVALQDADACLNAASALGAIGGTDAEAALRKAIHAAEPRLAWHAIAALGACALEPSSLKELQALAAAAQYPRSKHECEVAIKQIEGRAGK